MYRGDDLMNLINLLLRHKFRFPHLTIFEIREQKLPDSPEDQVDIVQISDEKIPNENREEFIYKQINFVASNVSISENSSSRILIDLQISTLVSNTLFYDFVAFLCENQYRQTFYLYDDRQVISIRLNKYNRKIEEIVDMSDDEIKYDFYQTLNKYFIVYHDEDFDQDQDIIQGIW